MLANTKRTPLRKALAAMGMALATSAALSAPILPAPEGYAVQYDDFWSYSPGILNYWFPDAGWIEAAGTGNLDVLITTRSAGQTNSGGDLAPYNIPDPIVNTNENPINGVWGWGGTADLQMQVSDLYDYLQDNFAGSVPVFTFDQNETGGNASLLVNARVDIVDDFGAGAVLHTWSFDGTTQPGDGTFDADSLVTAPGEICIPDVLDTEPGDTFCVDNNVGSGKFDYILYAPTMDLTPWVDADNLFRVTWTFSGVDDGGEEITLTGRFTPQVPEPEPLALTLLGLLALGLTRRRFFL